MKMKVGKDWTVEDSIEDWRDEYGYVKIRGRVVEDGTEAEFYVYDDGHVSAYEIQEDSLWDADWVLSPEEMQDVIAFVQKWLEYGTDALYNPHSG